MLEASVAPTRVVDVDVVAVLAWLSEAGAKAAATCELFGGKVEQPRKRGASKRTKAEVRKTHQNKRERSLPKKPVC